MLKRLDIVGNPNLGVFVLATDEIAIVPFNLSDDKINLIKDILEVDVIKSSISGSNLIGSLAIANSKGMVVSPHTFDKEIDVLKETGLNVAKLPDKYSAVGNIVAVNDIGAIASPFISTDAITVIEDTLDVDVDTSSMVGKDIIGSLITVTNKGFLIDKNATSAELEHAEEVFGVEGNLGTVGKGISFVGACCVANSNGAIVSENSTGPEMARVEEALGFLDSF
ncbi:translation initiation factor IF-6 [Methanobrevibacter sp. OttesenSCG-928-K11]|nr:translation initiation factor IF-6 [Methanobrevibacter sp. OttesenSCG-928-K11]MDL2270226.1 translation initiation factor IF-6 [Methanobrevibacter sp. OttesenSCG-928-I08]